MTIKCGFLLFLISITFCTRSTRADIRLTDVTAQTGIRFQHTDGSGGKHYIVEYVSAGLALLDYDRDGDIDIYFLNGAPMKGTRFNVAPRNALYRNDGNWKFQSRFWVLEGAKLPESRGSLARSTTATTPILSLDNALASRPSVLAFSSWRNSYEPTAEVSVENPLRTHSFSPPLALRTLRYPFDFK